MTGGLTAGAVCRYTPGDDRRWGIPDVRWVVCEAARQWPCGAVIGCGALLAACSLVPDHPLPPESLPAAFRNGTAELGNAPAATRSPAIIATSAPSQAGPPRRISPWWEEFRSSELNRLVETAIADNHDLGAAIARIAQAQAQAGVAEGALLPTVQASGTGQDNYPYGGPGTRDQAPVGKTQRLYQAGLAASYELDIWGKDRATLEAAVDATQSSIYDRDSVVLTLAADVTTAYFQYLAAEARVSVAQRNVANMTAVLDLVKKRYDIGEGTGIEVEQQATALAQADAAVPPVMLAREQARDQLATLIGLPPEELAPADDRLDRLAIPAPPALVPSQLLANRPDIRKAEADLLGANANIGVARAQLLPSFDITGQAGLGSFALSSLLSPASFYYLVAGNLNQTLFDNGKSIAQVDYARAVYAEKLEDYRQAILTALKDVEDALAAIRLTLEEEKADDDAVEQARRAYGLIQSAFRIGTTDYLTILDIERTQYQVEDAQVQARLDRLNAAAALFRGLGGDVQSTPPGPGGG